MLEIFVAVSENMEIKLPIMPNFLQAKIGNTPKIQLSVGDLTDDQLEKFADAWKKELIRHAKTKRKNKVT